MRFVVISNKFTIVEICKFQIAYKSYGNWTSLQLISVMYIFTGFN